MDRLLRPYRAGLRRRIYGRTKPGTLLKHQVPIRCERWDVGEAGWCEVDTVAHCGGSGDGEFVGSVNATDVASTWTETRSDSGSEFINRQCIKWCTEKGLGFTRSRPYHKNDNAHVEQKNWTHVRKVFGWKRFDSHEAVAAMNDLYANEGRLLMNDFQTSGKLVEKRRVGSRVRRHYDVAMTPLDRLIALKPFALVAAIERTIAAILALPVGPIQKRPSPASSIANRSQKSTALNVAFARAPVRSYMAR